MAEPSLASETPSLNLALPSFLTLGRLVVSQVLSESVIYVVERRMKGDVVGERMG